MCGGKTETKRDSESETAPFQSLTRSGATSGAVTSHLPFTEWLFVYGQSVPERSSCRKTPQALSACLLHGSVRHKWIHCRAPQFGILDLVPM
jgi:hypothetical protein